MAWNRGPIIGYGSSATVYLATTSSSTISAVKSSNLSRSEQLQKELKILSSLSSPNIVSYRGFDITNENNKFMFNLFMEYMPFGTLSQANLRHGGRLGERVIAHFTRQVVEALQYIHSKGVVHCDIKGSNILLGEGGVVKVGDFGCSKRVAELAAAPITGTPMFMAPEVARGEEQGFPCDVWALGCTVVELATGLAPWPNMENAVSLLCHVAYSNEVPQIPDFLSENGKDFLEKCFRRNPGERWTASQLLKHPFLADFNSDNDVVKLVLESSSCSPTSILEQGFWSSMEDSEKSECFIGYSVQTSFKNSADCRIRELAVCSGDPGWTWRNGNWINVRGKAEVDDNDDDSGIGGGSEIASTSAGFDLEVELEKRNVVRDRISGYFCEDYDCMDPSAVVVVSSFNFERAIDHEMLLLSTQDFL